MKISLSIKLLTLACFLCVCFLFAATVFADDVQEGIAAYKKGDFQSAYQAWHKAAEQNIAEAQWMLAILLLNGQGVKQDTVTAYSWLTLASEKQHKQAMIDRMAVRDRLSAEELTRAETLAGAFRDKQIAKIAINDQKEKAFHWFEQAAKKGDPQAQYQVGEMLLNGDGVKQDKVAAYSWFSLASEQNQPQAIVKQAQLKSELSKSQIEQANLLMLANRDNNLITDKPPALPELASQNTVKAVQIKSQPVLSPPPEAKPLLKQQAKAKLEQPIKSKPLTSASKTAITTIYRVQVGAFKSRQQVEIALAQLTKKSATTMQKYKTTITEPVDGGIKPDFYRLQLGSFSDKPEATKLCQFLKQNRQACFVVSSHSDE